MCSNYRVHGPLGAILDGLGCGMSAELVWAKLIRPTDPAPVVVERDGECAARLMQFSLVPSWSKERRPKFATHNARVESVATKSTWREPLRRHRCIVPISEFLEPIYEGEYAGHMVRFAPKDGSVMFAAGIWDRWHDREERDRVIESFAVLTTRPSDFVEQTGHDRQPLFVDPAAATEAWISGGERESDELLETLRALFVSPELGVAIERPMAKGWEQRRARRRRR